MCVFLFFFFGTFSLYKQIDCLNESWLSVTESENLHCLLQNIGN